MNGEKFFLWGRGQSKGMPLQEGNGGAIYKYILSHFHAKTTLAHLQFQHFRWVHDNLRMKHIADERPALNMTRAGI